MLSDDHGVPEVLRRSIAKTQETPFGINFMVTEWVDLDGGGLMLENWDGYGWGRGAW